MSVSWEKRIEKAYKRGTFTPKDRYDASEWTTCAVGERAAHSLFSPWRVICEAPGLRHAGSAFAMHVENDCVEKAAKSYARIQVLWAGLLKRIARSPKLAEACRQCPCSLCAGK